MSSVSVSAFLLELLEDLFFTLELLEDLEFLLALLLATAGNFGFIIGIVDGIAGIIPAGNEEKRKEK